MSITLHCITAPVFQPPRIYPLLAVTAFVTSMAWLSLEVCTKMAVCVYVCVCVCVCVCVLRGKKDTDKSSRLRNSDRIINLLTLFFRPMKWLPSWRHLVLCSASTLVWEYMICDS